jgi:hypothetical protein
MNFEMLWFNPWKKATIYKPGREPSSEAYPGDTMTSNF